MKLRYLANDGPRIAPSPRPPAVLIDMGDAQALVELGPEGVDLPLRGGVLDVDLKLGGASLSFAIDGVSEEDIVEIREVTSGRLEAHVRHSSGAFRARPCRIRCADGTEGQPCVTCTGSDGRSMRVCC